MRRRGLVNISTIERRNDEKEEFFSLLNELRLKTVIVEGRRDKAALERFNFKKIKVLNKGKSLYSLAEKFRVGGIIILTDFDPEGEEIAKKLTKILVKLGVRVDVKDRKMLRALFLKNKINTIEGLKKLFSDR